MSLSITDPKPIKIDGLQMIFPTSVAHMMPDYDALYEMKNDKGRRLWDSNSQHPMYRLAVTWFYRGLPGKTEFIPKGGIDHTEAMKHIRCILGSSEPKHEHKMAAVAFLLDAWFREIKIPKDSE